MDCPNVQSELGSGFDFIFVACVIVIDPFHLFASFVVVTTNGFPHWSFGSLENGSAEGVPVLVNWRWPPSFIYYSWSMKVRMTPSLSQEICRDIWPYNFL